MKAFADKTSGTVALARAMDVPAAPYPFGGSERYEQPPAWVIRAVTRGPDTLDIDAEWEESDLPVLARRCG